MPEALTEQQQLQTLRALFDRGPAAMSIMTLDGHFVSVNDAFCALFGYSRAELLALDTLVVTHPDDRPAVTGDLHSLTTGAGDTLLLERRCLRKDGAIIWTQTNVALARDVAGQPLNLISLSVDISPRKSAEEERRHVEERLAQERERFDLVRAATDIGFWFCDLPFDRLDWDTRVKEHFWLPPDAEVTIEMFYAQLHPEDRERIRQAIAASIEERRPYNIHYRTVGPEGQVKWIRAIGRGFYDAHGQPRRFDGVTLDVTEAKLSNDLLRENRERLQASLDAAGAGTFRWNLQSNELDWDENLDALFGLPRGSTVRSLERFVAMVHPDERAGVIERCERSARFGTDFAMEFRVIWPDGSIHWLDDRGRTFFDADGRPQYMTGACVDITTLKTTELALRESSERFRNLADNISQLAWMTNAGGDLVWYNRRWREFTGRDVEELVDSGTAHLLHPDHAVQVTAKWQEHLRTGQEWEDVFAMRAADGQYRWFLSRAVPIRDENGQVERWFGTNTDITSQREAAEALTAARDEAEKANRAKDHFLAALSHELRTPLAPVLMTAGALRNDERLPEDLRGELAMIERNIALEARLIDDLLELTRIGKGKLSLQRQWCDIHSLIAHAVEIVRDEAIAKGLHLHLDLAASHSGLMADPARVQQVIWNLLRNSVKFTPAQGRITIATANLGPAENPNLRIEVQDSGIGIDPGALEKIFAPFEQAESTRTGHFGGLGLGLAIARAIAEMHQGRIRAESEGAQRGAKFIVEFPGAGEAPAGAALHAKPDAAAPASSSVAPLRLLLVEDNEITLRVLSRLLERVGHHVYTARSCAEALEATARHPFDAVISDLGLPDGTGTDLMAQLRDRHGLRGIALSGYGMEEDITRAIQAGFAAHLVKPVDFQQLCHTLNRLREAT